MPNKIYDGAKEDYCPLWHKPCEKVCPTCKWQTHIRGKNPNTGQDIDRWDCAVSFQVLIQMEISQNARSGAAATESFRNEMVRQNGEIVQTVIAQDRQLRLPEGR
jgi:hypothetical protein